MTNNYCEKGGVSKEIEVYFLDYGHLKTMLRSESRISDEPWIWELQPLALPFILSGTM
jgi:hypothetical protein